MKNRKLFAILTLVAFMMTLLPVAAFAYSTAASTFKATNTSVDVYDASDDDTLAKLTVTFKDGSGDAVTSDVNFVVKTDRDAVVGYAVDYDGANVDLGSDSTAIEDKDGQPVTVTPNADGKVYIYLGSSISGSFKAYVYNETGAEDGLLIGSTTINVQVGEGSVDELTAKNEDGNSDDTFTAGSGTAAAPYVAVAGDGVELKAVIKDGGNPLDDEKVYFQEKYEGGSWRTIGTDETNDDGEATYYFEKTKAGSYEFRVKFDDETSTDAQNIHVNYVADDIKTIKADFADGKYIANDKANDLDFFMYDKYDNKVKLNDQLEWKVTAAPDGSKWEDHDYAESDLTFEQNDAGTGYTGKATLAFEPDKIGKYEIKLRDVNESRTDVNVTVESVKFEDATSLKFKLKNTNAETVTALKREKHDDTYGNEVDDVAGTLKVYLVNDKGVELEVADAASELKFASSNVSDIKVEADGDIIVKEDAAGEYQVTVYYEEDNVTGVYDLTVVGSPKALDVETSVEGKDADVTIQYVDKNGMETYDEEESYTIVLPAGVSSSDVEKIDETGKGTFELTAEEYGTYSVTVMTDDLKIVKTFTVEFEMPASEKPVVGAKNMTMFIGSTGMVVDGVAQVLDQAPFIQNGRTFVPLRAFCENAFDAEVEYDPATQVITITAGEKVVTMTIGSNIVTVDGEATVTDVAPFITDANRTVIPFRAVSEAFAADVEPVFAADGSVTAVTFAQ